MNNYAKVIELLEKPDLDYRGMVYKIAAISPSIVLKAVNKKTIMGPNDIPESLMKIYRDMRRTPNMMVQTIRKIREDTGLCLIDAKAVYDRL